MHLCIFLHRSEPGTPIPYTSFFCPGENYYKAEQPQREGCWTPIPCAHLQLYHRNERCGLEGPQAQRERTSVSSEVLYRLALKVRLNLPYTFRACVFQVFTRTNSCFSLTLNTLSLCSNLSGNVKRHVFHWKHKIKPFCFDRKSFSSLSK